MAYPYLLNLYDEIDQRLKETKEKKFSGSEYTETPDFNQGRVEMLEEFKLFLKDRLNQKLPRRIRKKIEKS